MKGVDDDRGGFVIDRDWNMAGNMDLLTCDLG